MILVNLFLATVLSLGSNAAHNRVVLQRAINAASQDGGGKVVIPAGEWLCGSVELKSGVELHLEKGAVLKGSRIQSDYNADDIFPENWTNSVEEWSGGHLIYAYRAENIAITGSGVIDGNGSAFFAAEPEEDSRFPWYKYGLKLHPIDRRWYRPGFMVSILQSERIRISGVTMKNTPCWTCHLRCCEDVTIEGVTIDADRTIANSDGFSIDCSRSVLVKDCTVKTGDDAFAIRAACRHHALTNRCEDIRIENCDIWSCCYGFRFGIGNGVIRNVHIDNCRIHEAAHGFGFTPHGKPDAKKVDFFDFVIRRCTVEECDRPLDMWTTIGSRCENILFEDCHFKSLEPSLISCRWNVCPKNFVFRGCRRERIERLRVRYNQEWGRRENRSSTDFIDVRNGVEGAVVVEK